MNTDFSSLDYVLDRFDIYRGDKFTFENNTLTFTKAGVSRPLIRTYRDMIESCYSHDDVATYFLAIADKIDTVVIEVLIDTNRNDKDCRVLRNRVVNLRWIMHEFVTQSKEIEEVNPFKELENRFWQQELELGSVYEHEEPCILHPLIEEFLSNSNIRSELYTKKYPFSDVSLNVSVLCTGIFIGKICNVPIPLHILIMLLEHHSALGDENAQEKLYSFLAHPLGKINLVDLKKASVLLETALKQEKMWAIKSKIKEMVKNGKDEYDIIPFYIMATHKLDLESEKKMVEILGEKIMFALPNKVNMIMQNYSIKRYLNEGFGTPWVDSKKKAWINYGVPLTLIGHRLRKLGASDNAIIYYEKAALLGDLEAMYFIAMEKEEKGDMLNALFWYNKAAEKGHIKAMPAVGDLEARSFSGHIRNLKKALKWFTAAANRGDLQGIYGAGGCEREEFEGHPANFQRALVYLNYAAEKGNPSTMQNYSVIMQNCGVLEEQTFDGHQPNLFKAMYYYTKASELGNLETMPPLACLENSDFFGHPSDKIKALYWYTTWFNKVNATEGITCKGELNSLFSFGRLEEEEFDKHPGNPAKALKLFTIAAKAGERRSMNHAGLIEEKGFANHKANLSKALDWYRQSANKGCIQGMSNASRLLLHMCEDDFGKKTEALKWCSLAGKEGNVACMFSAGQLEEQVFNGHAPNPAKALEWYIKIAQLGDDEAMFNAGLIELQEFSGHIPNPKKALEWFKQAAQYGNAGAMFQAAKIYLAADKDKFIGLALFWLKKAQHFGSAQADEMLNIAKSLSKNDEEIFSIMNHVDSPQSSAILDIPTIVPMESELVDVSKQTTQHQSQESDDSDECVDLELELSGYPDFSQYKSLDVSTVKAKFERMNEINNQLEKFQVTLKDLSLKNQSIWENLKNEKGPSITIAELIHFADDDAFVGKFSYGPTKNGIMFCIANNLNGIEKFGTVSTHRKHNKSYKGCDKNFLEEFRQMVITVLGIN